MKKEDELFKGPKLYKHTRTDNPHAGVEGLHLSHLSQALCRCILTPKLVSSPFFHAIENTFHNTARKHREKPVKQVTLVLL